MMRIVFISPYNEQNFVLLPRVREKQSNWGFLHIFQSILFQKQRKEMKIASILGETECLQSLQLD